MVARRWLAVGFALLAFGSLPSARGEDAGGARAGMRAHVDPSTGRLVPEPVVPEPSRLPAPRPPAIEEPALGGGMMIRLNGRFMNDLVATVNPDGSVHMDCRTADHPHSHHAE